MEENNKWIGLVILAIVAIVAVVGLVLLFKTAITGNVTNIPGMPTIPTAGELGLTCVFEAGEFMDIGEVLITDAAQSCRINGGHLTSTSVRFPV